MGVVGRKKARIAVVGATGYGGVGAIELLLRHPGVSIEKLYATADVGKPLSTVYPHLKGSCELPIRSLDDAKKCDGIDLVFFSTPDGVGQKEATVWLDAGARVIDYSGDFRFTSPSIYAQYAGRIGRKDPHASPKLLGRSVYGVPELHRRKIRTARIVGNPGCFAIATTLGLAPAVAGKLIDLGHIVCDGKSGVSGAGKKPAAGHHYPARYESVNAYKIGAHQHIFEVEHELSSLAGKGVRINFTPHVVPMTRGIMITIYAPLRKGAKLEAAYRKFYRDEPFVRVLGPGEPASTSDVRGSNVCAISVNTDPRTGYAVIVSHIDNLMKGQAGNAIQNMNLMLGFPEPTGLPLFGAYP